MTWSLYDNKKELKPIRFSNGKTQEDVVNEIVKEIKSGKKIIFVRGMCGTGKSAIALNVAKELGKASIVVPGKNLQKQYEDDYTNKKYLLKPNGEKLKIQVINGRQNHVCPFMKESEIFWNLKRKSDNGDSSLFSFSKKVSYSADDDEDDEGSSKKSDNSADNTDLPCKIELKDKNFDKLKEYVKQNNHVDASDFEEARDIRRMSVAPVCPYWSPILPVDFESKLDNVTEKKKYHGLNGKEFVIMKRKAGCGYYDQFEAYVNADVLIFNSHKYLIENILDRKPATEVEFIDECDEFLDNLSNRKSIQFERLEQAMIRIISDDFQTDNAIRKIMKLIREILESPEIKNAVKNGEIIHLKDTPIYDLINMIIEEDGIFDAVEGDENNYYLTAYEAAITFEDFLDDTYVSFRKDERDGKIAVDLVTTNLAKKFMEIMDKNKVLVMMSGTLHSENVLKDVFGLDNFAVVEAETQSLGVVSKCRTGLEFDCSYSIISKEGYRAKYLKALDKCLEMCEKPVLVHVNAFQDLPSEEELERYDLIHLISREKLAKMQEDDVDGSRLVRDFKEGRSKILFSTRVTRGVDFPGDICKSIVFTKYPNPNTQAAFWKILQKTHSKIFWEFYGDKAKREFLQRVYRALRSEKDKVDLWSPDLRVLNNSMFNHPDSIMGKMKNNGFRK